MTSELRRLGEVLDAIRGYKRIHHTPDDLGIREAARFLVSSLLLSHGIRRDTVAIVWVKGSLVVAPGNTLRHLRPDLESATGWVRAVLYKGKARSLGAFVFRDDWIATDLLLARIEEAKTRVLTCPGPPGAVKSGVLMPVIVLHEPEDVDDSDCWIRAPCGPPCRAALANIALDRVEAGLPV